MLNRVAAADRTTLGDLLREWRRRRGLSQLELASRAAISTRHLSFVETGRARPSREMVSHLAEELDVPLDERNGLMMAAGFAPIYRRTDLDDPSMSAVRSALESMLKAHEPYPALVLNKRWETVMANAGVGPLIAGADPSLLEAPINVLRLSLHPKGLAPRILNLEEWSEHLMTRLRRQVLITGDDELAALFAELESYPGVRSSHGSVLERPEIVVHLRLLADGAELSLLSTVTTFGTAVDLTLAELSVEAFYPADAATADALRAGA
jgi:transcriptional regulator with XRE-family HTH domain